MGFCLFNNVAVAAAHARARGAKRVAIVDWDVHHGNGTQDIFYSDPNVLFISIHEYPFWPGTGSPLETGSGDAKGATVNVAFSGNAGDAVYQEATDSIIAPIICQYEPDFVLISAGFDAHVRDPISSMRVTEEGYVYMMKAIAQSIPAFEGRLAVILEGGYDIESLGSSLRATVEALDQPLKDPLKNVSDKTPISSAHQEDLRRAKHAAESYYDF
jgi:acetoin utilization deacetylase AcuC-like enzyme